MAFNLLIILAKIRREQYVNAIIDMLCTIFICWITSCTGAFIGLATGMVASGICSLYLMANPVKLDAKAIWNKTKELTKELTNFHGGQRPSEYS